MVSLKHVQSRLRAQVSMWLLPHQQRSRYKWHSYAYAHPHRLLEHYHVCLQLPDSPATAMRRQYLLVTAT